MKLTFTKGNVSIEVVGETQKDVFAQLASAQEVFTEPCCAVCKSEFGYKFQVRTVTKQNGKKLDTYEFPELVCLNSKCKAKLGFGAHQEGGTLFPKRGETDDQGKWSPLGTFGWVKFEKKED